MLGELTGKLFVELIRQYVYSSAVTMTKKEKGVDNLSRFRGRAISAASVVGFMAFFQSLIGILAVLVEKTM